MTAKDKEEVAEIVRLVVSEVMALSLERTHQCSLGIKPETAHELISFADTWKTCRRYMIGGIITVVIGGLVYALWEGIKQKIVGK